MNVTTLGVASHSQLAVATPVLPDSPEKALLKQRNASLTDHVSWMTEHAEDVVYKEKQKAYKTLQGALDRYKHEYDEAVNEHRQRC